MDAPSECRESAIRISEGRDPLLITIRPSHGFDRIREDLLTALTEEVATVRGLHARLDMTGRDLDLLDVRRLVHLLRDEFDVHVVAVQSSLDAVRRYVEREIKVPVRLQEPADEPEPSPEDEAPQDDSGADLLEPAAEAPRDEDAPGEDDDEGDRGAGPEARGIEEDMGEAPSPGQLPELPGERFLTLRSTLRSGSVVRHGGHIVIFGDVNPGAEVLAAGSIIVLGALKGMAHAGTRGAPGCFIFALDFQPTQVRIGPRIAIPSRDRGAPGFPEIAQVNETGISIEVYRGRVPQGSLERSDA